MNRERRPPAKRARIDAGTPDLTREAATWAEQNRDAIDEYNALVSKRGLFGDSRRRF